MSPSLFGSWWAISQAPQPTLLLNQLENLTSGWWQPWAGIPDPGNSREYRPPIPVPKVGNGIFHSQSRSRKWEWNFSLSFPFPKMGMEFYGIFIPVPVTGNGTSKSGKVPFLGTSCISGKVKANIWFNIKELLWIHSIELSLFRHCSPCSDTAIFQYNIGTNLWNSLHL